MIKSMTGYGRCEEVVDQKKISVEIKSVNHRYFDANIRVPRRYAFLEDLIRKTLSMRVSRGKIDVFVDVESMGGGEKAVSLNESVAQNYLDVLEEMSQKFGLKNDVTVCQLSRFSDVFRTEYVAEDENALWLDVKVVLEKAIDSFVAMREREGERMKADVLSKADGLIAYIEKIEELSPASVEAYRQKLTDRIREMLGAETMIDEGRILTEAAIYADKIAVAEETVRLRSHIKEVHTILDLDEPVGRKLDFLMQEFNREANTIGSKANDMAIAKCTVNLKSEIEKMREQVQNIE